jgi:hypothetical protein
MCAYPALQAGHGANLQMNEEADLFFTHHLNKHYSFRPHAGQKEPANHPLFYVRALMFVNFAI